MVYVTQSVEPSPSSMKEIIQSAGGQVGKLVNFQVLIINFAFWFLFISL